MPLAKTAEPDLPLQDNSAIKIVAPEAQGLSNYEWSGIPIDLIRHFGVELGQIPAKDLEILKDISSWTKTKGGIELSIGDRLQELSKIQRELGAPRLNEKSYAKVHQFMKMQRIIDEMRNRQDSLKGSFL